MPDHQDLPRRSGHAAKAGRRLAWWLVAVYPPRFRRTLGLSLVDTLEDRMRARRAAGASTSGVWLAAVVDTLRNAPAEWARAVAQRFWSAEAAAKAVGAAFAGLKAGATSDRAPRSRDAIARRRTMIDKLWQDVRYALRLW